MTETVQITTLGNGLRVISQDNPGARSAALGVWVDAGARYEAADHNGVAHLLEHMAFKGTERRSALDIAMAIERTGGHLNASTSREHTAYYARVMADDLGMAADVLADVLQRSTYDPDALDMERQVVLQEIAMANDVPDSVAFDLLQDAAYPDQPMGRTILGPAEIVAGMQREQLVAFVEAHYCPMRMVLSGAGRVDHVQLVGMAHWLFGDMANPAGSTAEPARFMGGTKVDRRAEQEQVHICLAIEGLPANHPDDVVLQVLSTALGGGMTSRLFQEIREKRGLCYAVSSFNHAYGDTGLLGVYAATDVGSLGDLMQVAAHEMRAILDDPSEDELAVARAQMRADMIMDLEGSAAVCEHLALNLLSYGRHMPVDEILAKIDAVDAAAVRRLGRQLLAGKGLSLAAVGPLGGMPNVDLSELVA